MSWNRYLICLLCVLGNQVLAAETSVLLPLGGSTEKAAENIRNGLLAGYYHDLSKGQFAKNPPVLRFYDTTSNKDINSLVQQISTNSNKIIGPLLKEHVAQVLASPPSIPVLTLNRVNVLDYSTIWQFALAPEEEFAPLTQLMQKEGIAKVKVISSNDNNSKRLQTGFEDAWLAKGGTLLETYILSSNAKEQLEQQVKNLLTQSDNKSIEGFYLASPQFAQQVVSLLNFYQRNPVPIYSVSQAYDAEKSELERQDLNGLRFCGLPWVISPEKWVNQQKIRQVISPDSSSYDSLLAFGADAWSISQQLKPAATLDIAGRTGYLHISAGQVSRTPLCARVLHGKAQAVNSATGTTSRTDSL
ncbi:MAG: penicillin-binding protein activator [Agitococcus sp.]